MAGLHLTLTTVKRVNELEEAMRQTLISKPYRSNM